jgi:aryl-alcohol dehydrogenase-like predicted oxidoreductase
MRMRKLGSSGQEIAPIVLGGNVFGWTADKAASFAVLDAFLEAGFNAIDTANVYSRWVPGHSGGESESILGEWMADRGVRDRIVLITKVGFDMGPAGKGLSAEHIAAACEASLKRLRTDRIDLYFSHTPDADTPIEETLEAHQKLIETGKVRAVGASNYDAAGLKAALRAAGGFAARYTVLQPHYNVLSRDLYEGALEDLCAKEGLGVIPYYGLASGFLTGKYKTAEEAAKSPRGARVKTYFDARGVSLLKALAEVAGRHGATQAQVALAWLLARPSITAPIVSATSVTQLRELLPAADVVLSAEDLAALDV